MSIDSDDISIAPEMDATVSPPGRRVVQPTSSGGAAAAVTAVPMSLPIVGPIVKRIRRVSSQRVMIINESPESSCTLAFSYRIVLTGAGRSGTLLQLAMFNHRPLRPMVTIGISIFGAALSRALISPFKAFP